MRELGEERFVAHNVKTPSRARIFELFAEHRTKLNISIELATIETIKEFVIRQTGVAILPRLVVREELKNGSLVQVPVKGMKIEKVLRIIYRREYSLSQAARAFLEMIREGAIESALTKSNSRGQPR